MIPVYAPAKNGLIVAINQANMLQEKLFRGILFHKMSLLAQVEGYKFSLLMLWVDS
jgi:hypothetical protein